MLASPDGAIVWALELPDKAGQSEWLQQENVPKLRDDKARAFRS